MKKKQIVSTVTALLLAQSLVFSGCGNGSTKTASESDPAAAGGSGTSSGTTNKMEDGTSTSKTQDGSASSVANVNEPSAAVPLTIYVLTLYPVVDATVMADDKAALVVGSGTYEFSRSVSGVTHIIAKGGVVDLNGNGKADHGEPYAPEFKAGKDAKTLNPFSTMLANGMSAEDIVAAYPSMAEYAPSFDVSKFTVSTAKDALKATIRLSIDQYDDAGILNEAKINAEIDNAIDYEELNLIYQKAMFKIDKLYTDESMCLPLAPCVYPGVTPEYDVDFTYAPSESGSSSVSSEAASSASNSSVGSSDNGEVTPPRPK